MSPTIVSSDTSSDGQTTKYRLQVQGGVTVEVTHVHLSDTHIICPPTQVGCVIGCKFCVSGLRAVDPFLRNLKPDEMIALCRAVADEVDFEKSPKPLLIAFMGEGEPFMNFRNCVDAFQALSELEWPVPLRFSISTSGIRPDHIRTLADISFKVPLKLQVSLHGPSDEVRRRIVPLTKPLAEILEACRYYRDKGGKLEFNYVLCGGVNDLPEHADMLAQILGPDWKLKFNRMNEVVGSPLRPSTGARLDEFCRILAAAGITTEKYEAAYSDDINGGCGQLTYERLVTA